MKINLVNLHPYGKIYKINKINATCRKIIDNVRGEINKRQWIIFDGDVDPEWVENLNSVLDDNKLLTLPNGERLSLPPNVRVMFEVQDLKYATLATVSRCGMVWFSEDVLSTEMIFENYMLRLKNIPVDEGDEEGFGKKGSEPKEDLLSPTLQVGSLFLKLKCALKQRFFSCVK